MHGWRLEAIGIGIAAIGLGLAAIGLAASHLRVEVGSPWLEHVWFRVRVNG